MLDGIRPWAAAQQATSLKAAGQQAPPHMAAQQRSGKAGQERRELDHHQGGSLSRTAPRLGPLTDGPDAAWAVFIERARSNLHWVLAMSPVGDAFRTRCRQFPTLISCTTIDWFSPWPTDALASVAERALSRIPMLAGASTEPKWGQQSASSEAAPSSLVRAAAALAVEVHTGVQSAAERYRQELRRR